MRRTYGLIELVPEYIGFIFKELQGRHSICPLSPIVADGTSHSSNRILFKHNLHNLSSSIILQIQDSFKMSTNPTTSQHFPRLLRASVSDLRKYYRRKGPDARMLGSNTYLASFRRVHLKVVRRVDSVVIGSSLIGNMDSRMVHTLFRTSSIWKAEGRFLDGF